MKHNIDIGSAIDPGMKRKDSQNQDYLRVVTSNFFGSAPPLLVLADGMGGYDGGAIASHLVVESIVREYQSLHLKRFTDRELLEKGIKKAHQAVTNRAKKDSRLARMGSTVVAAIIENSRITLSNVGDSRAYVIDEDSVTQINWDHSIVADLVRQGQITPLEANHHPKRNVLSLSISALRDKVTPYSTEHELKAGEVLLLCSDGLWTTVAESQIQTVVMEMPPQTAALKLVELANRNQGPDNISVIVAKKK